MGNIFEIVWKVSGGFFLLIQTLPIYPWAERIKWPRRETPNSDVAAPVACLTASWPEEPSGPKKADCKYWCLSSRPLVSSIDDTRASVTKYCFFLIKMNGRPALTPLWISYFVRQDPFLQCKRCLGNIVVCLPILLVNGVLGPNKSILDAACCL